MLDVTSRSQQTPASPRWARKGSSCSLETELPVCFWVTHSGVQPCGGPDLCCAAPGLGCPSLLPRLQAASTQALGAAAPGCLPGTPFCLRPWPCSPAGSLRPLSGLSEIWLCFSLCGGLVSEKQLPGLASMPAVALGGPQPHSAPGDTSWGCSASGSGLSASCVGRQAPHHWRHLEAVVAGLGPGSLPGSVASALCSCWRSGAGGAGSHLQLPWQLCGEGRRS